MNLKNLEYIKSGLRELGFGENLYPDLESGIRQQRPRFSVLSRAKFGDQLMMSAIHLEKSAQSDKYRIAKYDTMIKKYPDHYENKVQTFFINKNQGVTLKEAFNLLEGRSILKPTAGKDGKVQHTWLQLDSKKEDRAGNSIVHKYGETHGFDLRKSLAELPILEIKKPSTKEMLIRSLQKGNLEQVTIVRGGVQEKMFIEASPQSQSVNVYDSKMLKVEKETLVVLQSANQPKQGLKSSPSDISKQPKNELASTNMRESQSRKRGLSH